MIFHIEELLKLRGNGNKNRGEDNFMDLQNLHNKYKKCTCGKEHNCAIDEVLIGSGVIERIGALCVNYKNILLVCDKNTYKVCGVSVQRNLKEKISTCLILEDNGDVLIPNEEKNS